MDICLILIGVFRRKNKQLLLNFSSKITKLHTYKIRRIILTFSALYLRLPLTSSLLHSFQSKHSFFIELTNFL